MAHVRNSRTVQRVAIDALHLPTLLVQNNTKKQIEKTARFLAAFDQIPLIYSGPDGEIIFGEEIWLALKATGATEAEVIFLNDKSPVELKAIRLALHRIPQDAQWIDHNVRVVLDELDQVGIDLALTGFDPPEIDVHLNLDLPKENLEESGSDIPSAEATAVSKRGVIWALGEHRVACADATHLQFMQSMLAGQRAAVCFTDPPYNLKVDGFISGKGRHRHREFVQGAGEMSDDEYFALLQNALGVMKTCCLPRALIYACIDWRHVMQMLVAGRACGLELYQIVAWIKQNGGMGGIYRNKHELICVFRAGDETPLDNVELGKRGRNRTNVWEHYQGLSSFGGKRDELLGMHPTVKPVAMIADALRDCTKRGEIVLDPFLGSGSTLMAAEDTGRVCFGVDLDPLHLDTTIRRWQNATGREAIALSSGDPFNGIRQRLLSGPTETDRGS
jgi:DNA modification methylase